VTPADRVVKADHQRIDRDVRLGGCDLARFARFRRDRVFDRRDERVERDPGERDGDECDECADEDGIRNRQPAAQ
jgi:hypothetical protein